jgi:hypothetical protein
MRCAIAAVLSASVVVGGSSATAASGRCRAEGNIVPLVDLPEASGIAVSRRIPGRLWLHNDSGAPVVFGVDEAGRIVQRVTISGAAVRDWEDIAVGSCEGGSCLYVADIGDNRSHRQDVTIYRVPEPGPQDSETAPARAIRATYPDGAHNAEGFFILPDGAMYIVTKEASAGLYRFPRDGQAGVLERVKMLPEITGRVTGAAATSDGARVAIRTHEIVSIYRASELTSTVPSTPIPIDVRMLNEPQGEGVAFAGDGLYLVGEGGGGHRPGTLARLRCSL